jgi:hypothetical protein
MDAARAVIPSTETRQMVRSTKWSLGLASVVVLGLLSAGAGHVAAQDGGKPAAGKQDGSKPQQPPGGGKAAGQDRGSKRAERQAKLLKLAPTAKTSLTAALATVEKETKSKVVSIAYQITRDDKLTIEARVIANDKFGEVTVDPDTGKAGELKADEEGGGRREAGGDGDK